MFISFMIMYNNNNNNNNIKIIIISRNDGSHAQVDIKIDNQGVEIVNSFCYLGCYITDDWKRTRDVRARLTMALEKMVRLNTIWKDKTNRPNLK